MSEKTKTIVDSFSVGQLTYEAKSGLRQLQATLSEMRKAAPELEFTALCVWVQKGDFSEQSVKRLIAETIIGGDTTNINGLVVSVDLVAQNAVIANIADIMTAVVELEQNRHNIIKCISYYVEKDGVLSVDTDTITRIYSTTLKGAKCEYYEKVKALFDLLNEFNQTYNHGGLWVFDNHGEITHSGQKISLKDTSFTNIDL